MAKTADTVRRTVNLDRQYCFEMTEKLKKWYQEQKEAK